jgi:hypothetical protein
MGRVRLLGTGKRAMGRRLAGRGIAAFSALMALLTAGAQPIRQTRSITIYTVPPNTEVRRPTPRVRHLINGLGSADPNVAERAEYALLKLCPQIEQQLRYALGEESRKLPAPLSKSTLMEQDYVRGGGFGRVQPAERQSHPIYTSLAALLERCTELRYTSAPLITIHAQDAPLTEVLRQFGQQTHASVTVSARSFDGGVDPAALDWVQSAHINLKLDHISYWAALRSLLDAIHTPDFHLSLFVDIGKNHLILIPRTDFYDIFRDPEAKAVGPLLLAQRLGGNQLIVTAALIPALAGFSGTSKLTLDRQSTMGGVAMAPIQASVMSGGTEDRDFDKGVGYAYEPSEGLYTWRQRVRVDPVQSPGARASFSIGMGVTAPESPVGLGPTISLPLSSFLSANRSSTNEEQVYVLQDCKALQAPTPSGPVYAKDSECSAHNFEKRTTGEHRETTEGVILRLTNHRDHPVTYVSTLTYFVKPAARYQTPDQTVVATAIYHTHAESGQAVDVRMASTYREDEPGFRYQTAKRISSPNTVISPQSGIYDHWRITVSNVVRNGEIYEIFGQLHIPKDAPANPAYQLGDLKPVDSQGWDIEHYPFFSEIRTEGDHSVQDFRITTLEPGRLPATLVWSAPEDSHWLTVEFIPRER